MSINPTAKPKEDNSDHCILNPHLGKMPVLKI